MPLLSCSISTHTHTIDWSIDLLAIYGTSGTVVSERVVRLLCLVAWLKWHNCQWMNERMRKSERWRLMVLMGRCRCLSRRCVLNKSLQAPFVLKTWLKSNLTGTELFKLKEKCPLRRFTTLDHRHHHNHHHHHQQFFGSHCSECSGKSVLFFTPNDYQIISLSSASKYAKKVSEWKKSMAFTTQLNSSTTLCDQQVNSVEKTDDEDEEWSQCKQRIDRFSKSFSSCVGLSHR